MPGIGMAEIAVIFLLLLVVVGPDRLPQVARTVGRAVGEARRATDELKHALILDGEPQQDHGPRRTQRRPRPGPRTLVLPPNRPDRPAPPGSDVEPEEG